MFQHYETENNFVEQSSEAERQPQDIQSISQPDFEIETDDTAIQSDSETEANISIVTDVPSEQCEK